MDNYADIRQHPRYMLKTHRPMPEESRAAQFAAFAALTGFDEEIDETARLTVTRAEMAEDDLAALDETFRHLIALSGAKPLVTVTYFQRDAKKGGGAYVQFTGNFRFFDQAADVLRFTNGAAIAAQDVSKIEFV